MIGKTTWFNNSLFFGVFIIVGLVSVYLISGFLSEASAITPTSVYTINTFSRCSKNKIRYGLNVYGAGMTNKQETVVSPPDGSRNFQWCMNSIPTAVGQTVVTPIYSNNFSDGSNVYYLIQGPFGTNYSKALIMLDSLANSNNHLWTITFLRVDPDGSNVYTFQSSSGLYLEYSDGQVVACMSQPTTPEAHVGAEDDNFWCVLK